MSDTAFFGKIPTAGDFVRLGVSESPLRSFETWVHDAHTDLRQANVPRLPARCHIVYPVPEHACVVVAIAMPSQDRVGRAFPAVMATALPTSALPASQAAVLVGVNRFFGEAATILQSHTETQPLWDAVQAVQPPTQSEFAQAETESLTVLQNASARDMEGACFSEPDDRYYAYHTLRLATREVPPPHLRVLSCPTAARAEHRLFWAEAVGQAVCGAILLPMMWLDGTEQSPLLIALGTAPKGMLRFLLGQPDRGQTLWPLCTEHQSAREHAKTELAGENWNDPGQTFSNLLDALSRI